MARYDHLELVRLPEQLERRKGPGFGRPSTKEPGAHSRALSSQLNETVEVQRGRRPPAFVDPSLILRVRMTANLHEPEWEQLGLTVVSNDADRTLVLFSTRDDLTAFQDKIAAYGRGPPAGKKGPRFAWLAGIESIGNVEPRDRIGSRLRAAGFSEPYDFPESECKLLDLELWDFGERRLREAKLREIAAYIESVGGEAFEQYLGTSLTMLRVRIGGATIRLLLGLQEVASLDLPPVPDLETSTALDLAIADIPALNEVDSDAPCIGIVDSGINVHPLNEDVLVGAIGVPDTLGTADEWGHGTRVGGIALFGDLRAQLAAGTLARGARIASAKVVNERGEFDDRRLVPSQMREAITALRQRFGCRIFVVSLGDRHRVYDGGKVGSWAAALDEVARDLDALIVVSAGNRPPRPASRLEEALTGYPGYLLEPDNRFVEPAGAMNVLTVGAVAHGEGLDARLADNVMARPIAGAGEPSPFSRVGPGIDGSIKPELVDTGAPWCSMHRSAVSGQATTTFPAPAS